MKKFNDWIIEGDINAEMVSDIAVILNRHKVKMILVPGNLSKEASLISTPEMLNIAAAIASVLSFFLNMWLAIRQDKRSDPSLPGLDKALLERRLVEFKAVGFEIDTISSKGKEVLITMTYVPKKQTITVKTKGDLKITIRRQRSKRYQ
jgi:hypothetical protein